MKQLQLFVFLIVLTSLTSQAQYKSKLNKQHWVDSVFNSLNDDQRIAQLMVVRAHSNLGADHVDKVVSDIKKYNIGALCFFQGGPVRQANLTNYYQSIAQTPLMVTIDGEWGLGMRLDSVTKFPYQLTLGSMSDKNLVYRMGLAVGEQCKRIGVHVNYAPVVDINNNPNNPVIGFRSFGENKIKVSEFGVAYMKGMQDAGIMACAKHFPGHGDVDVDSHYDLPVINKSMAALDTMELVPFNAIFDAGVGSVMIAHLYIPAIDNTANRATSISKNNVTDLLRNKMGYKGLTFTDALEMKGVAKYFPQGTIAAEAIIAGNDMLCLPADVGEAIEAIKNAIKAKKISWDDIYNKTKKVLESKYQLGLNQWNPIETNNLLAELNAKTDDICREVATKSITLLNKAAFTASRNDYADIPLKKGQRIAYIGIGTSKLNEFGRRMMNEFDADVYTFSYNDSEAKAEQILKAVPKDGKYDAIIVGIHNFSNRPAGNYGISPAAINLWKELNFIKTETIVFGNVLATKNFCDAWTLVACYQDDDITQQVAADYLKGKFEAIGTLPVRVCRFNSGDGIVKAKTTPVHQYSKLNEIDSIVADGIAKKAFPGCVVLAVHDGNIIYHKAYETSPATTFESIFDLASVTKISATTVSVMKLYEEGKLDIKKTLGDYLPLVKGTDKADLKLDDIILHQAGLVPYIAFYKETIDPKTGKPNPAIFSEKSKPGFTVRVAENIFMRNDWQDTMFSRILNSKLSAHGKYVYSDNDFIFLGKIVEQISGMPLNEYAAQTFYRPIGMTTTGFKPRERFAVNKMVPTETENHFRMQTTQGDVHDEGASMFGGVSGHAGLFSDAYDLAMLYQMLLNGGIFNGKRYLKKETIDLFTAYHSDVSRRGYGFDKPEKDNALRKEPYPSALCSPATFGHTGFTGTCVWVDPKASLVYVFLSNRVYPTRDGNLLGRMNIRSKIQDTIYRALGEGE